MGLCPKPARKLRMVWLLLDVLAVDLLRQLCSGDCARRAEKLRPLLANDRDLRTFLIIPEILFLVFFSPRLSQYRARGGRPKLWACAYTCFFEERRLVLF